MMEAPVVRPLKPLSRLMTCAGLLRGIHFT
jgi:hypothetical protein